MCPPSQRSLDNLIPPKPGEVRNPEGHNQYTSARGDFERWFCREVTGELSEADEIEALKLPPHMRRMVETGEVSRGRLIATGLVFRAMQGEKDAVAEVLARLSPKTSKHEIEDTAGTLAALIRAARE
jgi:hypothetical protein